jgi:uncharacterized protein YecE (DUF72 family)
VPIYYSTSAGLVSPAYPHSAIIKPMGFLVGTCGYDYPEWVGAERFYPPGLESDRKSFLTYYASQFALVELNFTHYGHTSPKQMEGMLTRVRPEAELYLLEGVFKPRADFAFSLKAYRELTHEISERFAGAAGKFQRDIAPLREAGKLAAVVFQFPPSFRPGGETANYLAQVAELFADYPAVFEFRHQDWFRDQAVEGLRRLNVPLCWVDGPASSRLPRLFFPRTGGFAYARFHGRNEEHWWAAADTPDGEAKQARYHYRYANRELEELAQAIGETGAPKSFLLFNNHVEGNATRNARDLQAILDRLFVE